VAALEQFFTAALIDQLRMVADPDVARALRDYLGDAEFEEYRVLADSLDVNHLAVGVPKNLVFVPGVMGSMLGSSTKGGIWWLDVRSRNLIDELRLSPDGTEDADPSNAIIPMTPDPVYIPFLSAVLQEANFNQELFPYDWRKSLTLSAAVLRDTIVRLSQQNSGRPIHLVGHSMGGLMIRVALMQHGAELWPLIGRVVFIGTPHFGSPAIAGYLKNHLWGFEALAALGLFLSRATFRSLWGVMELLPAPRGIYPGTRRNDPHPWVPTDAADPYLHPCANFDLYRADSWGLGLDPTATARLQDVLDGAAQLHRQLLAAHQALPYEYLDRMLVIAGVGYQTLFRLAFKRDFFGLWDHADKVTQRVPGDIHREGDSRVPLASARLDWLAVRYVHGVHGGLPNIPAVFTDTFAWLRYGRLDRLSLPDTPAGALSQHLAVGDITSQAPQLDGSARVVPATDDPGTWKLDPSPTELSALRARVDADEPAWFNRARLL
jgi:pimeloyl-ACP methyl ester carboxylesterase